MKIAILTDRKTLGGVEKIAIEQVKSLIAIGVDAKLVLLRREKALEKNFQDILKNVPVEYLDDRLPKIVKLNMKFPVFHFFSLFHLSYPLLIPWVVAPGEFDYVIVHGTFTTFTAISLKIIRRIPFSAFIWDPIGYILERVYKNAFPKIVLLLFLFFGRLLDRLILETADSIMVGGKAHNKYFKRLRPSVKIDLIPPSVHKPKGNFLKKKKQILLVTAWKKGKKIEFLKDLLPLIPKVPIKVVGKWLNKEYLSDFKKILKLEKLESQVEITGSVTEKELSRYYNQSLIFLQINDDRGFGMPALEAAAYGDTIVIPQGQGVCALFKDKVNAFFVRETDLNQIASILQSLLKNIDKTIMIGEKARLTAEKYTWENHAKTLLKSIRKNLKGQK